MYPASFEYLVPSSLQEAISLLGQHGDDAKLLAGGHSLIPAMKLRLQEPKYLVDISRLPDMRGIREQGGQLVIGALTLHADVATSDVVRRGVPGLAEAAERIGDVQVRNRGTIGGSVAHADPNADYPVILLALNASFVLTGPNGSRTVAADDFFVDLFTTTLDPSEVVTEVHVPGAAGSAYAKFPHPASGYLVVSCGALLTKDASGNCASARVAVGGLAGKPVRATTVESALAGKPLNADTIAAASAHAADGTDPDDDLFAPAIYKRHIASVYTRQALESAAARL
ncbi:MAG TPA: xanthine dehydrogenase family protein subunit M [Chloroflexota bacterium]|nr:xanthine dehydrogenase family protein subunit M [Chloroflexota bacterium]